MPVANGHLNLNSLSSNMVCYFCLQENVVFCFVFSSYITFSFLNLMFA